MTAERIPGDPEPYVVAALRTYVAGWAAPIPRVAREVPKGWDPQGEIPLVTVDDDGGPLDWPILTRNTVRVTVRGCRGTGKPQTKRIALRLLGHLFEHLPVGLAHIRRTGVTVITTRDSATGVDLASFTVTATARTETITV